MGAAKVNGVEIEWREAGKGEPIVFVHGFPFHSAMWGEQLNALPKGWRGIAPDLRGFGASEPGTDPIYTMELFAQDLHALLDRLSIERAVLCGLSMGGYVLFEFWRLFPKRVRALVLADTRAGPDSADAKKARESLAKRVEKEGNTPVVDGMLPKVLNSTTRYGKPEVVQVIKSMMQETSADTMARALRGMAERPDSEPLLRTINVPCLVVVGSEDAITGRGQAEFLARGIRGSSLEIVDDVGHVPPLEKPADFNKVLGVFLSRLSSAPG
jgi:pimeloyl-ACP methyl ester carboxylesterase